MPKTNKKNGTPKAPRSEAAYIRALSTYDRMEVRRILGSGWHNKGAIARGFVSVAKRDCRFFLEEDEQFIFLKWLKKVSGADVNSVDRNGRTALGFACRNNKIDIVRWLLEEGADINQADKHGATALMVAIAYGHTKIARLLIEKGADTERKDKHGRAALDVALAQLERKRLREEITLMTPKAFFEAFGERENDETNESGNGEDD